jgi:hypothetical protein
VTKPNGAPPGWYPDPLDRHRQRYWDGQRWTDHAQPAGVNPSPLDLRGSNDPVRTVPWWQTWWVIVPALLVCLPLGLIGLWKRPGLTKTLRWWTTGGAAALLALVTVLPAAASQDAAAPSSPRTSGSAQTVSPAPRSVPSPTPSSAPTPTPAPAPTPTPTPQPSSVLAAVPKVVGLTRPDARELLTRDGLKIGRVEKRPSSRAPGTVLRQNIKPGTRVKPHSEVTLVVARPFPRVPNVVGLDKTTAVHRIRSAGFRVDTSRQTTTSGADRVVLSQSPSGHARKRPGGTVHLVVSDLHVHAAPPVSKPPTRHHTCTTTSSGSCIQGGEFCPQADYGLAGYDADGRRYICTGDNTHPHWE